MVIENICSGRSDEMPCETLRETLLSETSKLWAKHWAKHRAKHGAKHLLSETLSETSSETSSETLSETLRETSSRMKQVQQNQLRMKWEMSTKPVTGSKFNVADRPNPVMSPKTNAAAVFASWSRLFYIYTSVTGFTKHGPYEQQLRKQSIHFWPILSDHCQ